MCFKFGFGFEFGLEVRRSSSSSTILGFGFEHPILAPGVKFFSGPKLFWAHFGEEKKFRRQVEGGRLVTSRGGGRLVDENFFSLQSAPKKILGREKNFFFTPEVSLCAGLPLDPSGWAEVA